MEDEFVAGRVLDGKYRVERVIGRGGMGVVVAARHLGLDEPVAIKFLSAEAFLNAEIVARFEREARAAVKIKSEHVVRVFDVGRLASGAPYMVMELLEGEDLSARLAARGPLPVEQAVDFVLHACVALAAAHAAGIVHRDIKPGNLFCTLSTEGQPIVKVLDFGISKISDASRSGVLSVTRTSAVLGSPLYMSPEQVQSSKDVDSRTDIWALGVVLFELLGGRVPFPGESFGEVAVKISTSPLPPLSSVRPGVAPGLEAVVARCLEKDRSQRFASVGELAAALRPFASVFGQSSAARISRISAPGGGSATMSFVALNAQPATTAPNGALPDTAAAWAAARESRSTLRTVVGSVAALVVVLGVGAAFLLKRPPAPAGAEAPSSAAASLPTIEPPPSGVTPPGTSASAVAVPTPVSAPEASAEVAPEPTESTPAVAAPFGPVPQRTSGVHRPARATVNGSSPSPAPAPPRPVDAPHSAPESPAHAAKPAAAPKADCDPPYVLDDQGRKRFKPECFLNK